MHIRRQINGTNSADEFFFPNLRNADLFGNDGNDNFLLMGAENVFANGGRGNDRYIIGDGLYVSVTDLWGNDSLAASDADVLDVNFGDGRNILSLDEAENFVADLGAGNDAAFIVNSNDGDIYLGQGADVLKIQDGGNIFAEGGAGVDTFRVENSRDIWLGDTAGESLVNIVDSRAVTVNFGTTSDNTEISVDHGDGHVILGGSGNDVVRVFNPDGSSRYELGAGDDELHLTFIFVNGEIGFLNAGTIIAGAGADTLYVDGSVFDGAILLAEAAWLDYNPDEGDQILSSGAAVVQGSDVLLHNTNNDGVFSMTVTGAGLRHPNGIGLEEVLEEVLGDYPTSPTTWDDLLNFGSSGTLGSGDQEYYPTGGGGNENGNNSNDCGVGC